MEKIIDKDLTLIVAMGKFGEIGQDNNMLWNIKEEMKTFKETTTGHTIIMGRKTMESLPKGFLPNRRNIVISSFEAEKYDERLREQIEFVPSVYKALEIIKPNEKVFIIGGASIYEQFFHLCDTLIISFIDAGFEQANKFFPTRNFDGFDEISSEDFVTEKYNFTRKVLKRK